MNQVVHVFIASTKGLVAVQNITDLNDPDLQSVITLNGTSDMANISSAYHRFVQKCTGLIQREFGGTSYRLNLSRNIEQGASWQLGVYLAHHLSDLAKTSLAVTSENAKLASQSVSLGNGIVEQGDIVFCVTGQVNTTDKHVEGVTAVAEKIIAASAQVSQWQKQGVLAEFVYPEANKSQHFPELDCSMHRCSKLSELIEHVNSFLPTVQNERPALPDASNYASHSNKDTKAQSQNAANSMLLGRLNHLLRSKIKYVLMPFVLLLLTFTYVQMHESSPPTSKVEYVISKKSGGNCDANAQTFRLDVGGQYVTQASPAFLGELCGLYLHTSESVPQVWMITDTKAVMELRFLENDNERVWRINLPQYQQANRQFYLIITPERLDLSDLASLTDYLGRVPSSQNLSVEVLAEFFTTINVNPQYLSHRLLVKPE